MNNSYKIEFSEDEGSVHRIADIFARNQNPKSTSELAWQYITNPGGGHITAFAIAPDGTDAAVYSVFLVPFLRNSKKVTAAQSLDTLTDKQHRGQGLFTLLAEAVYSRCTERQVDFVYGFPNSFSGPGFFKKLGWQELGQPPFLINIMNLGYIANRLTKDRAKPLFSSIFKNSFSLTRELKADGTYSISRLSQFDDSYDQLWNANSIRHATTIDRDSKYMQWRYIDCPRHDYNIHAARHNGRLEAVCVATLREKHGGKIGYIMDIVHTPGAHISARLALQSALHEMRENGADVALAWNHQSTEYHSVYKQQGFFKLPRAAQPIKLFFGGRKTSNLSSPALNPDEFFLSYADSDTV